LYGVLRDQLAAQIAFFDRIENTHLVYLSVGSGLLGVLAAVFALRNKPIGSDGVGVFVITGVFYLILVASSIWSQRVGKWNLGPKPEAVKADYEQGLSANEIKWKVVLRLMADYEANRKPQRTKRLAAVIALGAIVCESLSLFGGLWLVQSQI
jgi:hypothetical protein